MDTHSRERWLRWKVYAGDLAAVGSFAGALYIAFGVIGWSAWTAIGALALAGTLGKLFPVRKRWVQEAHEARRSWLLARALGDERPPLLILRSFQSPLTMPAAMMQRLFGKEYPVNADFSPASPRSHFLQVASELRELGPPVAISAERRGVLASPRMDVLCLEPKEAQWFSLFEFLSSSSRAVCLVPGETSSVLREVKSLRDRGLLTKLIVVMPPLERVVVKLPWLMVHTEEFVHAWETTRGELRGLDIALPEYDRRGLVISLSESGAVRDTISLDGSFVFMSRAVKRLLESAPPSAAIPLAAIMRDLGRFELPEISPRTRNS